MQPRKGWDSTKPGYQLYSMLVFNKAREMNKSMDCDCSLGERVKAFTLVGVAGIKTPLYK